MVNISLLPSCISIMYLIINYLTVLIIHTVTRDITLLSTLKRILSTKFTIHKQVRIVSILQQPNTKEFIHGYIEITCSIGMVKKTQWTYLNNLT